MNVDVPILSDKEEKALQRMELLKAVRPATRRRWYQYFGLAVYVIGSLWVSYRSIEDVISGPRRLQGFIWLVIVAFNAMWMYWTSIIAPLHRRIDALTQLVEEEIRNRR